MHSLSLHTAPSEVGGRTQRSGPRPQLPPPVATAAVHCGSCSVGLGWLGGWARLRQSLRGHLRQAGWLGLRSPHSRTSPAAMAPRPLSPLVLALGGAAAVLGSVLFILWKTYFGNGRERRWDGGEAWWAAEPAGLPQWDEWDVSARGGSAPPRVQPRGCDSRPASWELGAAGVTLVGAWRATGSPGTLEPLGVWGRVLCCASVGPSLLARAGARARGRGALSRRRRCSRCLAGACAVRPARFVLRPLPPGRSCFACCRDSALPTCLE